MARGLWSGSLSFGLVNVPVQLVTAARDLDYHFRQIHEKDKTAIEQRRYCSEEDVEVTGEEIAHAYDLDGKQVVVTDEELASVQPRKTRTIEIEAFVDLADVDPLYFDHPYWLGPARERGGPLLGPPVLARARRRERGHAARLPPAGRGDGQDRPRRPGPVRDAHEGVPRARARARRCARPDNNALRRRGPADQAGAVRGHEAGQEAGRQRRGGDRGALDRLGPPAL